MYLRKRSILAFVLLLLIIEQKLQATVNIKLMLLQFKLSASIFFLTCVRYICHLADCIVFSAMTHVYGQHQIHYLGHSLYSIL